MSNIFDIVDADARLTSGRRKVIITCAVTGSVHTPSMSEYLPVTPVQIAEQAIEAARAGAAILHLHARNPDGSPTPDPTVFDEFVPVIAAETDAILNITTSGGAPGDPREAARLSAQGQAGTLLPQNGLDEFRLPQVGARHRRLEALLGEALRRRLPKTGCSEHIRRHQNDSRPSSATSMAFASSSNATMSGQLHNLAHCVEEGLVKGPLFIQCALGVLGGHGAGAGEPAPDAQHGGSPVRSTELRVLRAGRRAPSMSLVPMGAIMGGHVRGRFERAGLHDHVDARAQRRALAGRRDQQQNR